MRARARDTGANILVDYIQLLRTQAWCAMRRLDAHLSRARLRSGERIRVAKRSPLIARPRSSNAIDRYSDRKLSGMRQTDLRRQRWAPELRMYKAMLNRSCVKSRTDKDRRADSVSIELVQAINDRMAPTTHKCRELNVCRDFRQVKRLLVMLHRNSSNRHHGNQAVVLDTMRRQCMKVGIENSSITVQHSHHQRWQNKALENTTAIKTLFRQPSCDTNARKIREIKENETKYQRI